MSKVITYSTKFPKKHIREGEKTYFVEKLYNSLEIIPTLSHLAELNPKITDKQILLYFYKGIDPNAVFDFEPKHHTIRAGNRFKKSDYFSPRVWSEKPYCSPQIILAKDVLITEVYDIEIFPTNEIYINKKFFGSFGSENFYTLANNDGLSGKDFISWFSKLPFKGQIICWSNEVKY
ncbi:MAG: hypothetical protein PHT69_02190 [Bacteroidales bacterium]|nr:hypothetical protein [Bacteroidales bacterium]